MSSYIGDPFYNICILRLYVKIDLHLIGLFSVKNIFVHHKISVCVYLHHHITELTSTIFLTSAKHK